MRRFTESATAVTDCGGQRDSQAWRQPTAIVDLFHWIYLDLAGQLGDPNGPDPNTLGYHF